ncbi:MAG: cadherin-like domain-containing protein, partial [Chitinispirillaceae bacterium]|nr:cadherin-like domain-containing protein [Chitinispirillaceae bacterium]
MHVDQSIAYIGAYNGGQLYIIDATDKRAPLLLSTTGVTGTFDLHDIWYSNNWVYTTHRSGGASKIDVTDRLSPIAYPRCMPTVYTHTGVTTSFNPTLQMEVLYVAEHSGIHPFFKVYDPETNILLGVAPINGDGRCIEVTSDGKFLYQAAWYPTPSIQIFNVEDAAHPVYAGQINIFPYDVTLSPDDHYLYISYDHPADGDIEGVMVLDVSTPAGPTIVNTIPLPGARDLTVDHSGKRLFVRTRSNTTSTPVPRGIYAYDISNLAAIDQIDYLPVSGDNEDFDLWYENGYLYYTDDAGGSQFIIIHVDNQAPSAEEQEVTVNEDNPVTFTLQASDPDEDPLTFEVAEEPSYGSISGTAPNLTYTPDADYNGTDFFSFTVNDGDLESSATVSITVNPINDAPVIDEIAEQTVSEGSLLEFENTGSDIDGDALTFSATDLPTGATFTNGTFTWTPDYTQAGSY